MKLCFNFYNLLSVPLFAIFIMRHMDEWYIDTVMNTWGSTPTKTSGFQTLTSDSEYLKKRGSYIDRFYNSRVKKLSKDCVYPIGLGNIYPSYIEYDNRDTIRYEIYRSIPQLNRQIMFETYLSAINRTDGPASICYYAR